MILMTVGQKKCSYFACVILKICDIGQNIVYPVHILLGEAHSAVDNDDVAAELIDGHIFAYLIQTAKRNDLQFRCHYLIISLLSTFQSCPRSRGSM